MHGPWFTSADAWSVIAFAEVAGFVREPSLTAKVYEEHLIADALEALTWVHERGLLETYEAVAAGRA